MEKNKATMILKDIMEKLSLIKKEELSKEVVEEQLKEEAEMSLKLTEEAVNEEVHLEEVKPEDVEVTAEEVKLEEQESELISDEEDVELDMDKYVTREQYEKDMASMKKMIEDMEIDIRAQLESIYIQKTREIVQRLVLLPNVYNSPIQTSYAKNEVKKYKFNRI